MIVVQPANHLVPKLMASEVSIKKKVRLAIDVIMISNSFIVMRGIALKVNGLDVCPNAVNLKFFNNKISFINKILIQFLQKLRICY